MVSIEESLAPGERVVYRTRLHWLVFGGAIVGSLLTVTVMIASPAVAILILVFTIIALLYEYVKYATTEIAVTEKRVVVRHGWFITHSWETTLRNIESIGVEQGCLEKRCGYGTVVIIGTGGTKESIGFFPEPFRFRDAVFHQLSAPQPASS